MLFLSCVKFRLKRPNLSFLPRIVKLEMNEVIRVGLTPPVDCPCVIVVRHTPVVLRNRHVAIGVHRLDVSNVPICKPRDIAAPGSFAVELTGESSRIDPVACTFPADTLVAGGERYSTLVELVSDITGTFAFPLVPFVQDLLASVGRWAYTFVIIRVDCQGVKGDKHEEETAQSDCLRAQCAASKN